MRGRSQALPRGTTRQPQVPDRCQARPPDGRWLEQSRRLSRNGAIAVEAIGAAVERAPRIVPDLGGQQGDVAARDIGRVADHEIEGPVSAAPKSQAANAAREARPRRPALSRAAASASRLMSVPMPVAFGSSVSSAISSAPEPVPRSAMRNARVRGPPLADRIDRGKRRLDDGLGLRPRHQRGFVEPQRQAPEFLDAEDARDRLAVEPPRGERRQRARASPPRLRPLSIVSPVWSRPSAWPTSSRASSSGESSPAWRKASASARRACATVMSRDSDGIRCLRPPAARPDAR